MKILSNQKVHDSYHNPNRKNIMLSLYPDIPSDIKQWATEALPNETTRSHFLNQIGEQYSIDLIVDKDTGDFEIAQVTI